MKRESNDTDLVGVGVPPLQGHDLADLPVQSPMFLCHHPCQGAGEDCAAAKTSAYSDFYQSVTT